MQCFAHLNKDQNELQRDALSQTLDLAEPPLVPHFIANMTHWE